ncbi:MAG: V-type ATP synthase subunit B [Myxococcota bacterium]|nr:V-type ATP synthase subunit B [Myxococcota bacterium]
MNDASEPAVTYLGVDRIAGPLVFVGAPRGVSYGEAAEVECGGARLHGRVLEVGHEAAVVEIFEGTSNLSLAGTRVRFLGRPLETPVGAEMLGRTFNGRGAPIDGGPPPVAADLCDVNGVPINPVARDYPREFIQTGVSAIDGMNTLVRGQKLPIFSASGLPHDALAAQIVRQACLRGEETEFAVVFAAIGVNHDVARIFRTSFEESGALARAALFLNLADDPTVERLMTPRTALTLAEHLAFDAGMHVLVVMTDVTNYCEALREVASAKGEVPSRKGYPGYLYSDLASLYERAGRLRDREGSITQLPILTMPNEDITHPIPDLTGFITEGQIVLSRDLHHQGIDPPIDVPPSLSRLMQDGIGPERTRDDHSDLANQLYASMARLREVRRLVAVIGEEELSELDRRTLEFGRRFEREFLRQDAWENRPIERTLELGWQALRALPEDALSRVRREHLDRWYRPREED